MDKDKLLTNCSLTIGNYSKMADRLEQRNNISQFLLIYYGLVGIIDALLYRYFDLQNIIPTLACDVFEFWDILIAIVMLVFSFEIALLKYPERVKLCIKSLNTLKHLKSKISIAKDIDVLLDEYYETVSNIDFLFTRTDFYYSCKEYDNRHSSDELKKHFRRFEILTINLRVFLENLLYVLLMAMPIVMYVFLFFVSKNALFGTK